MKPILLLAALLATTVAKPNGIFHEEFQYQSNSESYRNNELQHKKEDEGFFSKDGDLEGRTKPKINAEENHSEYVNPRSIRNGDIYDYGRGTGGRLYDVSHAGSSINSIYDRESLTSTGGYRYSPNRFNSHGSSAHGSSSGRYVYGDSGYTSGVSSGMTSTGMSTADYNRLTELTQRLEQEMSRQIEQAVRNQYSRYSSYGYGTSQLQGHIRQLEEELRRNLTLQLRDTLQEQTIGGYSHSMDGGRYNNMDVELLQRQLEDNLIRQLNEEIRTVYSSSSSSSMSSSRNMGSTVTYVSEPHRPVNYYTTVRIPTHAEYVVYTPIPNPDSITVIATRVQSQLNDVLNEVLRQQQERYLRENSYHTLSNLEYECENLRRELLSNLTRRLDVEIARNYGQQMIRDQYAYSVSSDGRYSSQYNYRVSDLENLKQQIQNNLISKFDEDIRSLREQVAQRQNAYLTYTNNPSYTTARPVYTSTSRPIYTSTVRPYYSTSVYPQSTYRPYTSTNDQYASTNIYGSRGSHLNTYDYNSMQNRLQQDLSQQLNAALQQNQYQQSSYVNSHNYDTELQRLTEQLRRNLTQRLDESFQNQIGSSSSSSSSYSYGQSSGSVYPYSNQMNSMRSQLQEDLLQQLRQGLEENYNKYRSFRSSSSSSYGYAYGGGSGQMLSDDAEDCMYSDDPSHVNHRQRRSVRNYSPKNTGGYQTHHRTRYHNEDLEQQAVDDSDLTQQVEDTEFGKLKLDQQEIDSDLTQQTEDSGYGKLEFGQKTQDGLIQQEETGLGQLEIGSQTYNNSRSQEYSHTGHHSTDQNQVDYLQIEDNRQFSNSNQKDNYNSDSQLTQQIEDDLGKLELPKDNKTRNVGYTYGSHSQLELDDTTRHGNTDFTQKLEDQDQDLTQAEDDFTQISQDRFSSQSNQLTFTGEQTGNSLGVKPLDQRANKNVTPCSRKNLGQQYGQDNGLQLQQSGDDALCETQQNERDDSGFLAPGRDQMRVSGRPVYATTSFPDLDINGEHKIYDIQVGETRGTEFSNINHRQNHHGSSSAHHIITGNSQQTVNNEDEVSYGQNLVEQDYQRQMEEYRRQALLNQLRRQQGESVDDISSFTTARTSDSLGTRYYDSSLQNSRNYQHSLPENTYGSSSYRYDSHNQHDLAHTGHSSGGAIAHTGHGSGNTDAEDLISGHRNHHFVGTDDLDLEGQRVETDQSLGSRYNSNRHFTSTGTNDLELEGQHVETDDSLASRHNSGYHSGSVLGSSYRSPSYGSGSTYNSYSRPSHSRPQYPERSSGYSPTSNSDRSLDNPVRTHSGAGYSFDRSHSSRFDDSTSEGSVSYSGIGRHSGSRYSSLEDESGVGYQASRRHSYEGSQLSGSSSLHTTSVNSGGSYGHHNVREQDNTRNHDYNLVDAEDVTESSRSYGGLGIKSHHRSSSSSY